MPSKYKTRAQLLEDNAYLKEQVKERDREIAKLKSEVDHWRKIAKGEGKVIEGNEEPARKPGPGGATTGVIDDMI